LRTASSERGHEKHTALDATSRTNRLTVTRSEKGSSTNYAIENGRLRAQHKFQLLSSHYLLLNMGDSAGTFNGFGGCTYTPKSDKFGRYLEVEDFPGDTEPGTSTEEARPWDFWGSSRAP